MRRSDRHPCFRYRLAAVLLLAHLLAIIALAASPRLHHWVHPDADDDDHDCAVELFLHGGGGPVPVAVVAPVCAHPWLVASPPGDVPVWVAGIFAVHGTLEHAPPRTGRAPTAFPAAAA